MIMKPLKTLKGSKIWYSKFGVGKTVGSKIYIHIDSHFGIIPDDVWKKATKILIDKCYFSYGIFSTLCYDFKKPNVVRFDICEGFCTEREPVVGQMVFVDTESGEVWNKYNSQIYHHKWMWVPEGFEGFDVQESYEWSKHWLSMLPEVASGYPHKWAEQLKKYNII
jgi:hypothetical protein